MSFNSSYKRLEFRSGGFLEFERHRFFFVVKIHDFSRSINSKMKKERRFCFYLVKDTVDFNEISRLKSKPGSIKPYSCTIWKKRVTLISILDLSYVLCRWIPETFHLLTSLVFLLVILNYMVVGTPLKWCKGEDMGDQSLVRSVFGFSLITPCLSLSGSSSRDYDRVLVLWGLWVFHLLLIGRKNKNNTG